MKKFIYKIFLFFCIFFLIGRITSLFIPYHWGNPWFSSKIQYLEKHKEYNLPDTYFFGSSLVYRQIDPFVIDSVYNNLSDKNIQSFNLGAPATFCPQTYFLFEEFLKSELSRNTKNIFLELGTIDIINNNLLHQERTTYWQHISEVLFVFKSVINNNSISSSNKQKYLSHYTISYVENIFHIGHFGEELLDTNYYDDNYYGSNENGFYPLEEELFKTNNSIVINDLNNRKQFLKDNINKLVQIANISIQHFYDDSGQLDHIHLHKINRLIELSDKNGIKLIFVLYPRNSSENLVNLYKAISDENKIQLSNAEDYPQFYTIENSFDIGHLNTKGAHDLSCTLAKEFYRLIQLNKI